MENIVLVIHLVLALALIAVVLLQRSEGGGLGMGGGGGGAMSSRGAATALGKMTWGLAVAFIGTSIWLTIIAAQGSGGSSVLDRVQEGVEGAPVEEGAQSPSVPGGGDLLPPPAVDGGADADAPSSGEEGTPQAPPRAE